MNIQETEGHFIAILIIKKKLQNLTEAAAVLADLVV